MGLLALMRGHTEVLEWVVAGLFGAGSLSPLSPPALAADTKPYRFARPTRGMSSRQALLQTAARFVEDLKIVSSSYQAIRVHDDADAVRDAL